MASDRILTVPNLLSLARLVLSIVLFVAIERGAYVPAFWLFAVAASTDWVDGWWARRFGQVSRLGRIFDPLVDKVLVCGSFTLLAAAGSAIAPWLAAVLAGRAWPGLAIGDVGIETAATWLAWGAISATAWSGIEYLVAARPLVA